MTQLRNWLYYTWASGDHIAEQAIHNLDKMIWAMDDKPPIKVKANGGSIDWINCGLCVDERGVGDWIDGCRRGAPKHLVEAAAASRAMSSEDWSS